MRTSLLLEREPFGEILSETLQRYWKGRTGLEHSVHWYPQRPAPRLLSHNGLQVWFGNVYLNFFAVADTSRACFRNLRREYANSTVWWRRWPQRVYVECAIGRRFRNRLAQVAFGVTPAIKNVGDSLILGGNRRLRMLHLSSGVSTVMLKQGFPPRYLSEEIGVRQLLSLELAPKLCDVCLEDGWYEEEYVEGTPINRLSGSMANSAAVEIPELVLKQLVQPTLEGLRLGDRIDQLSVSIETLSASPNAAPEVVVQVAQLTRRIRQTAVGMASSSSEIPFSITHGDFQHGNVLLSADRMTLIDWECTQRRHAAYDALVYALETRMSSDWSSRFGALLRGGVPSFGRDWPGLADGPTERRLSLLVFLLEELHYILSEKWEVPFVTGSGHLQVQLREIEQSLRLLNEDSI